jgi:hypothetical protein
MSSTQLQLEREIINLLESAIEDTRIPDAIAAHADKRAGKPVTVKDAEQLEAQLGMPVRISKRYGMTHVAWAKGDGPNPWRDEGSILISHGDTNVRWPTADVLRQKEPAHYGARDERNQKRRALLQEHKTMRDAIGNEPPRAADASCIYNAADAILALRRAREALRKLFDYDEPMHVARYDISRIIGVDVL